MAIHGVISACQFIAAGLWMMFCVVWLVAAFGVKRNIVSRPAWCRLPARVAVVAVLLLVFVRRLNDHLLLAGVAVLLASPVIALIGTMLCAAGIGFAIWARMVIGTNWGMPMTLKQGHELVTAGPYAHVRHPIYAGVMLAMLGSVLVISLLWLVVLLLNGAQFVYAARKEEQLMLKNFPNEYPAYMRRTKMIIPFVI
jgi:protein-S-isoprenylcysteine O-methyltransferase Ste14